MSVLSSRAQRAAECLLRRKWEGGEQKGEGSSCSGPLQQAQSPSCPREAQIGSRRCGELCPHHCQCWQKRKCQGRCRSGPLQCPASTKDAVWDPLKTSGSAAVLIPPGPKVQIHEQGKDGGTEQKVGESETLGRQWFYS